MTDFRALSIDGELADFLQRGLIIALATRDREHEPCVIRALGCRVSEDALTLYLPSLHAAQSLDNVADNGMVAAVFSDMATHYTLQIKGRNARYAPIRHEDVLCVERYWEQFIEAVGKLSGPKPVLPPGLLLGAHMLSAVRFTPTELYEQTPGPQAGERLRSAA